MSEKSHGWWLKAFFNKRALPVVGTTVVGSAVLTGIFLVLDRNKSE